MRLIFTLVIYIFSLVLHADNSNDNVLQRIEPIGKVRVQTNPQLPEQNSTVVKGSVGKDIYERHCSVCHLGGLAGAPKFRNESDWQPRQKGKSLDDLTQSAIKGLNAMPAKGTCYTCSTEDIKAAISYMLSTHE